MRHIFRAKTHRNLAVLMTSATIGNQLFKDSSRSPLCCVKRDSNRLLRAMDFSHSHGLIDGKSVSKRLNCTGPRLKWLISMIVSLLTK